MITQTDHYDNFSSGSLIVKTCILIFDKQRTIQTNICIPSSSLNPGLLGSLVDHSGLVTLPPTQGTALGARESLKRLETCQVEHMRTREKGLSG